MFDIFDKKSMHGSRLIVPIVFFLFIAAVSLCLIFLPQDDHLALEKRDRAQFPKLTAQAFFDGTWESRFETWIADAMPGRNFFMALNAYGERALKGDYFGDIYRDQAGNLLEAPFGFDEVSLSKNLAAIAGFADKIDVPVYLLVPPTAGYADRNHLPERVWKTYYDESFMNTVVGTLGKSVTNIDLLDAFSSRDDYLFYSTDHHWNAQGAYTAYRAICGALGLQALEPSDFDITTYSGFVGTNYSRSALYLKSPDTIELWKAPCSVSIWFSDTNQTHDSLFFKDYLDDADMYPVYLDGNHGLSVVENLDNDTGKVVMLIKDSYANSVVPLLIANYDRIVVVDIRNYKLEASKLIDTYGVTEVIVFQSVEHLISDTNLLWIR